ncbi:MAG: glycosyltransferase family 2 protein [Anaerolineae bacterium]
MNRSFRKILFAFFLSVVFASRLLAEKSTTQEKPIVVLIPSYNNERWYVNTLFSVFSQKYHNYRIIYIDDASTDRTAELVKSYVKEQGQSHRVTFIQNQKRMGSLANIYRGIWLCAPEEIIANLDGDDWFASEHVLEKLNKVYSDPSVWATYGQFVYFPSNSPGWAAEVPRDIIEQNAFREYPWVTTALRTFYAGLFQKIKKEDLLYHGEFFPMAGDLAYMWPILEMVGHHSRFIPDVLYVYNIDNPINDMKKDVFLQSDLSFVIRQKNKYNPVTDPFR